MLVKIKTKNTKKIEELTFKLLKQLGQKTLEEKKLTEVRNKINLKLKEPTKIKLYAY